MPHLMCELRIVKLTLLAISYNYSNMQGNYQHESPTVSLQVFPVLQHTSPYSLQHCYFGALLFLACNQAVSGDNCAACLSLTQEEAYATGPAKALHRCTYSAEGSLKPVHDWPIDAGMGSMYSMNSFGSSVAFMSVLIFVPGPQ